MSSDKNTPSWRARLAERRAKPGDGRPLPPFRWWHTLGRSLFLLDLTTAEGVGTTFAVDVRQLGDRDDGEVRARLYRDGRQTAVSKLPARFAVPGGHIEVAARSSGLRRCHFVPDAGEERQLTPHPRSAEGLRARLHHRHPVLSTVIGVIATLVALVGVCITVPQIIETISQVPAIADNIGTFASPIHLPPALNVIVTIAVVLASTERALRLRSSWLDDLAT
ncbi:hypothetical protein QSU92_12010 [Microbacterium sp. ET2]|uniref:hypothetical protein n=1 Tax=Microbacterium albipurpureum TaxID=3050384 RepID=UPI00259CBCF2|nr:hypothetical protein [Microbacterium sp. ET2 (Ac-2212)]WJL94690.1 hypothetical protein QSU92_12010 [Microbacterium sp. ET2 (Ac-2212)]